MMISSSGGISPPLFSLLYHTDIPNKRNILHQLSTTYWGHTTLKQWESITLKDLSQYLSPPPPLPPTLIASQSLSLDPFSHSSHSQQSQSQWQSPHHPSMFELLETLYPEECWQPWQFKVADGYWQQIHACRRFFDWFADGSNHNYNKDITSPSGWYSVAAEDIVKSGGKY